MQNLPLESLPNQEYKLVDQLPGSSIFKPQNFKLNTAKSIEFDTNGNLLLAPGDYSIPVMTYCLKHSAQSPSGYSYVINQLQGPRAELIREISLKAFPRFHQNDVQILIWSILAGLNYDELTPQSQKIMTESLPDKKDLMKTSLLHKIETEWNQVAEKSFGTIPRFDSISDNYFFLQLDEAGRAIAEMRAFKKQLTSVGNDFNELSRYISTKKLEQKKINSWSQISDLVYVRFETDAEYQSVGFLQIRVLESNKIRKINSVEKVSLNYSNWFADPLNFNVQPLSFSMLFGFGGVATAEASLVANPYAAAAIIAAVLAAKIINWDDFFKLYDIGKNKNNKILDQLYKDGQNAFNKEHDSIAKPLKDAGIITEKNRVNRPDDRKSRIYEKSGDNKTLKSDFDKLPGQQTTAKDGTQIKNLPDGNTAVLRPNDKPPTLEIQSPIKLNVKTRYLP